MILDLVDHLLGPARHVHHAGRDAPGPERRSVVVRGAAGGSTELDLMPGGLALVDLPPGTSAVAEFRFRDVVKLGRAAGISRST